MIAPSAPTPTRAARSSSGSAAALSSRTLPSPSTSSIASTCAEMLRSLAPVPWVPVEIAPAIVWRVDVAEVLHRQPEPGQLLVQVGEHGAAADPDQARAAVGVEHAAQRVEPIIVPSVIAASVKEWPEPATQTFCPAAAAAPTASASSSRSRGAADLGRPAGLVAGPVAPFAGCATRPIA